LQGQFTYVVSEIRIVSPDDTVVLAPTTDNRLTLTTCHPKFSAKKRLIVIAALQGEPVPASTAPRADEPAELAGEVIPADAATDDGSTNNDDPAIGAVTPTSVAPDDPAGGASSSAADCVLPPAEPPLPAQPATRAAAATRSSRAAATEPAPPLMLSPSAMVASDVHRGGHVEPLG
jgi:hypothetical protein